MSKIDHLKSSLDLTSSLSSVASPVEKARKLYKIRTDPWEFLKHVKTLDQVDKKNPVKNFPIDLSYLRLYAHVWLYESKILVPKSRRMKMSWINIALVLWDCLFHSGRSWALVSKKEEDSNALVKRALFIYEELKKDPEIGPFLPAHTEKWCTLRFPEINSEIGGFPSGADQLRQYTFSGLMFDEMAFWEHAQKAYAASMPTTEGGGKLIGISSPAPGFFKRLVFDQLEKAPGSEIDATVEESRVIRPMKGIRAWRNRTNNIFVFELHYTADPSKRSEDFKKSIRESLPWRDYLREYELHWDTFEGLPVYADFDSSRHLSRRRLEPEIGLPILRGWDWGLTPACVVAQLVGEQLRILREFTATNMGAERFIEMVESKCKILYPAWSRPEDMIEFIDPAGYAKNQSNETVCAQYLLELGDNKTVIGGAIDFETRRKSVEYFLVRQTSSGPCLIVDKDACPIISRGFDGGYRYPEKSLETGELKPVKDLHSHPHDGLQMITSKIHDSLDVPQVEIGQLSYDFGSTR